MNREYLILNKYYLESIMPKMVPPYINGRIENYGESLVFDLLKNAPDAEIESNYFNGIHREIDKRDNKPMSWGRIE